MGLALPQTPVEIARDLGPRLKAASVAHRDAQEVAEKRAAAFRAVIVEALDAGMPQKIVAELAGVSRARVHQILAAEYSKP